MAWPYLCIFPSDISEPTPDWPSLCARLKDVGLIGYTKGDEELGPGPHFDDYCTYPAGHFSTIEPTIRWLDHGGKIGIHCGPMGPPQIPGTGCVVDEWVDFASRWIQDPTQRWLDPATGLSYSLLDLDFGNQLAACRWALEIVNAGWIDGNKVATLFSKIAGIHCRHAFYWL